MGMGLGSQGQRHFYWGTMSLPWVQRRACWRLELPQDLFPGSAVLLLLLPDGLQSRLGGSSRFAWQALLV